MVSAALSICIMDILWFIGCNIFLDDFLLSNKLELWQNEKLKKLTVKQSVSYSKTSKITKRPQIYAN